MNPEPIPSFKLPWFIQLPARILSAISSRLATRFALSLFFKPLKFPIPKRERPMREESNLIELLTKNAAEFKVFEHKASGPKVLMIHGWSGRGSQFFKIWDRLIAEGFHCVAIEAPAHGDLLGAKTHMLEFVDAVEETVKRCGHFDFAIGHSLGGMALFNALARNIWFDKLVIIGSPANIRNVVGDFVERIQMKPSITDHILNYIEKRYEMDPEQASSDRLCQVYRPQGLIIHDKYDQDVPVHNAQTMHQKWRGSQYLETKGLGHRKVLMDQVVIERIYVFFKN